MVDCDAAIMPPFLAGSGMAFEQQAVRLHDPVPASRSLPRRLAHDVSAAVILTRVAD
jgi:hypothetical protein